MTFTNFAFDKGFVHTDSVSLIYPSIYYLFIIYDYIYIYYRLIMLVWTVHI